MKFFSFLELVFGYNRQKLGRICKNLFDYARLDYLKTGIKLKDDYVLNAKYFYYIEPSVTLENAMIYVSLDKKAQ